MTGELFQSLFYPCPARQQPRPPLFYMWNIIYMQVHFQVGKERSQNEESQLHLKNCPPVLI